jgi:hypothetical protein
MAGLPKTTLQQLLKLPQRPTVWEGDRFTLGQVVKDEPSQDLVLWMDLESQMILGSAILESSQPIEALLPSLLQAMQQPLAARQGPGLGRPKTLRVRTRELQFFLRGALQGLDIEVTHAEQLPLLDAVFADFQETFLQRQPETDLPLEEDLHQLAYRLWKQAPWNWLGDHQIVEVDCPDLFDGPFYACVLGNGGETYGILFYRSLEALHQFRQRATAVQAAEQEPDESTLLSQDCLFLNYNLPEELDNLPHAGRLVDPDEIDPFFGSIHPLEGIRPLNEPESEQLWVALEAFYRFWRGHGQKFKDGDFPPIQGRYRIELPDQSHKLSVQVRTMHELAQEYAAELPPRPAGLKTVPFREDLIPDRCGLSLEFVEKSVYERLRQTAGIVLQSSDLPLPGGRTATVTCLYVQLSRSEAQTLVRKMQTSGGLKGLCLFPLMEPILGTPLLVAIAQLGNGEAQNMGTFEFSHPASRDHVLKQWQRKIKGKPVRTALLVAHGLVGEDTSEIDANLLVGLFEGPCLTPPNLNPGDLFNRF